MRHAAGDLGEIVVFSHGRVRKPVQSPANPLQLSISVQPEQVFPWNPDAFDVAGPDEWALVRKRQNAIRFGRLLRNVCSNAHLYTLCNSCLALNSVASSLPSTNGMIDAWASAR